MAARALIEAGGLLHPALEDSPASVPLAEARWTDRQKLAALFEASALLAHLEHAGRHLAAGFRDARARADGRLFAGEAAAGRSRQPAQELLRDLLGELFGNAVAVAGNAGIAGRGESRRAARTLLDAWRHSLAPLPADETVRQILEAAPFLWEPAYGPARQALAAESSREGRTQLWVAGPGAFRTRLLARCDNRQKLTALLASPAARDLWEGEGRAPVAPGKRLAAAAALHAQGRFVRALATLSGLRSPAAAVLRLRCRFPLGEAGAVRDGLRRLAVVQLSPQETLDAAEVAVRAFANAFERERAREWVERALAAARSGSFAARAHLLAAEAAWDRGAPAALATHLEAARPALDDPALAWRWYQVKGLQALAAGDGEAVLRSLCQALAASRRHLARHTAAGLWNDLGIGRVRVGDLAGAERAFRHSARLFGGGDGPRRTTLALSNLAEVRLRRGEPAGVREILEQSRAENRLAGNRRGLTQDSELWVRLELLLGRPEAALALCREALHQLGHPLDWRRPLLHVLAARALGWLGRVEEAAAELAETTPAARAELEAEERPALLAHAGDREGALAAAADTPFAPLWRAALAGNPGNAGETGETLEPAAWDVLAGLEPYRAARLIFDLESLGVPPGGIVPAAHRRAAVATLRRIGAGLLAERLEARGDGPWQALFAFVLLGRLGPIADPPAADPEPAPDPPARSGGMVGESPALQAALERLSQLAPRELTVLVLGETGTGKELAARLVHRASPRAKGPFVAVNCAALGESLLLADLFGHVRGAFTGADRDRAGVFETAQRGTVFLDEIGDLPAVAQGMLLRVLQEGEVRRVGESLPRRVDVRVVAATHRDLAAAVAAGSFRGDLFYRLKVGSVLLPPLRERGGDVLLLADHFLARQRGPGFLPLLSRQARERLLAHRFPGNIRELENVLAVAAALAGGGTIEPAHLDLPEPAAAPEGGDYHRQVEEFRRQRVVAALAATAGNQAEAARLLGLSRQALSYLVRQFKLY